MADINYQRTGKDPLLEMDFLIEIEGVADIGFRDFSEIKKQFATAEYRTGDGPNYKYKQDGGESVETITLTRGVFRDDTTLRAWFAERSRKTVDIVRLIHDRSGDRRANVCRLYETRCPSLSLGKGDAMAEDSNAIEEMTLEFEDWDMFAE